MIIHLSNRMVYTIPNGVKYANISIALHNMVLKSMACDLWKEELDFVLERDKDVLCGFRHIGYETIVRDDMQIRLHWFIHIIDLNRCSVKYETLKSN